MGRIFSKVFIVLILTIISLPSIAQEADDDEKVVQFSGVIVEEDSTRGIPGAHIYVPGKRRGTTANFYGYFSFPVLVGDTVVISSVGYRRKTFVIPENDDDLYTVVIPLQQDTVMLEEVPITPYPTEELFKEAILAMRPSQERDFQNMQDNLDPAILAQMYREMPMDGSMNHTYFMQQQHQYMFDGNAPRSNPLLNPFAWADFFKSLKKK